MTREFGEDIQNPVMDEGVIKDNEIKSHIGSENKPDNIFDKWHNDLFGPQSEQTPEEKINGFRSENEIVKEIKTKKYRFSEDFCKVISVLDEIAKKNGFSGGIDINEQEVYGNDKRTNVVSVNSISLHADEKDFIIYDPKTDTVSFGKDILDNIKYLFEIDKDLASKGIAEIIKHEKQHLEGIAREITEKGKTKTQEIVDIEIDKGNKDTESFVNIYHEIFNDSYPKTEFMTEVQRINNNISKIVNEGNYKDKEEIIDNFIETEAKQNFVAYVIYHGIDALENINFNSKSIKWQDSHFSFIKPNLQKRIFEQMEEMRPELIKKRQDFVNARLDKIFQKHNKAS